MKQPDEFYIGWEAKAAPGIGKTIRITVGGLLAVVVVAAIAFALAQRLITDGVFEWGHLKMVSGVLESQPYPHLLVTRPGKVAGLPGFSSYYLVAPWKFGLPQDAIAPFAGKPVTVKGTLIYRGGQTMIETKPEWIQATAPSAPAITPTPVSLGRQTLTGEIVDSKCFLGVMNPGQYLPHRACAIRCISGGVPPILVVHAQDGSLTHFLLVSAAGQPVNQQVLNLVAEPVEITGEVVRQGELLILSADPATYRRRK